MSMGLDEPLEEEEFEELSERLSERAGDDSLLLDGLHGLITAVAIGPEPIPPSQWMPMVLESGTPFESTEEAEHLVALILRLSNTVVRDLERLSFEPILGQIETEDGEPAYTAHGWCEGFALGLDLQSDTWERAMQNDAEFARLIAPIVSLAADEGIFASEDGEDPEPLSEAEYEVALNALPAAVLNIQNYWREREAAAQGLIELPEAPPAPTADPAAPMHGGRRVH